MLSSTVTVASQLLAFPPSSVTVKGTVLAPKWVQSNAVWPAIALTMVPLSVLPPSMSDPTITALPEASS